MKKTSNKKYIIAVLTVIIVIIGFATMSISAAPTQAEKNKAIRILENAAYGKLEKATELANAKSAINNASTASALETALHDGYENVRKIGGTITKFGHYDLGCRYKFYDADNNEITNYTVNSKGKPRGLDNAVYYTVDKNKEGFCSVCYDSNGTEKSFDSGIIKFTGDDTIDADGVSGADTFRVIKKNGDGTVELMAMNGKSMHYNDTSQTTTFSNGGTYQKYEGSTLDNYLNGTGGTDYYGQLPQNVKAAIVDQNITQNAFYNHGNTQTTGANIYTTQYNWTGTTYYKELEAYVDVSTPRKVYALDLLDIYDYIGGKHITSNEQNKMFFGQETQVSRYCWLRSANTLGNNYAWLVYGYYGYVDNNIVDNLYREARPAFTINLTGLNWE